MDNQKINLVNRIISKHLKIPHEKLSDDISHDLESNWDSVAHLKMISEIEESMKIKFSVEEIISLDSVGRIRGAVIKKIKGRG